MAEKLLSTDSIQLPEKLLQLTDTYELPETLSREELLKGDKYGIHETEEPITGHKKIHCARYERPWWKFNKEMVCSVGLSKVEIPKKSFVIRPWTICSLCDYWTGHADKELRANNVKFQTYEPLQREECPDFFKNIDREMMDTYYCFSNRDKTSGYEWNGTNHPVKFDYNVKNDHAGITFYLDESHAKQDGWTQHEFNSIDNFLSWYKY